jgi:glycerate 2-kinase
LRDVLLACWRAALDAVRPEVILPPSLPRRPIGATLILAVGKAAVPMAEVAQRLMGPAAQVLAITRRGQGQPWREGFMTLEAGHPDPTVASVAAGHAALAAAAALGPDDHLLVLLSGGASSLLAVPPPGVTLAEMTALNRALLASGAPITDINIVRRALSGTAGGRLAAACRGRVATRIISDVAGDAPADIGSGPTVANPTTGRDARSVLEHHGIGASPGLLAALDRLPATPAPGDVQVIGSGAMALAAVAGVLRAAGFAVHDLGDGVGGDAVAVAQDHAARLAALPPGRCALISGGETTVRVARDDGRGGRNLTYLAALLHALGEDGRVHALAADTDGIDGSSDAAGAFLDPTSTRRAAALGLSAQAALETCDTHALFAALGDLHVTGPTGTNVNDLRIVLRDAPA